MMIEFTVVMIVLCTVLARRGLIDLAMKILEKVINLAMAAVFAHSLYRSLL